MNNFTFGDIVIVEDNLIGVIVKSWYGTNDNPPTHEVYVRSYNKIKTYSVGRIRRYMVVPKELTEDDLFYQDCCEVESNKEAQNARLRYLFKDLESEK